MISETSFSDGTLSSVEDTGSGLVLRPLGTAFGEYTTDAQPTGWTARWTTTSHTWRVRAVTGTTDGKVLRGAYTQTIHARRGISWDAYSAENVDIITRQRSSARNSTSTDTIHMGPFARGSGSGGSESAYIAVLRANSSTQTFQIGKYVSGTYTALATENFSWSANTFYWFRLNVTGTTVRAKVWGGAVGDQPVDWTVSTTDSSLSGSGWVGLFSFYAENSNNDCDSFSFYGKYIASGNRVKAYSLDGGTFPGAEISWTSTEPTDTEIKVYASLNSSSTVGPLGEEYDEQTSGTTLTTPTSGEDVTGKYLWIKQELSTADDEETPILETFDVDTNDALWVNGAYHSQVAEGDLYIGPPMLSVDSAYHLSGSEAVIVTQLMGTMTTEQDDGSYPPTPAIEGSGSFTTNMTCSGIAPGVSADGRFGFRASGKTSGVTGEGVLYPGGQMSLSGSSPSISGTARMGFRAQGTTPAPTGEGLMTTETLMSLTGKTPVISGDGRFGMRGRGISAPVIGEGLMSSGGVMTLSGKGPAISAEGRFGLRGSGKIANIQGEGLMTSPDDEPTMTCSGKVSAVVGEGFFGFRAAGKTAGITGEATMIAGGIMRLEGKTPSITADSRFGLRADGKISGMTGEGLMVSGGSMTLTGKISPVLGSGYFGMVCDGKAPVINGEGSMLSGGVISLSGKAPAPTAEARFGLRASGVTPAIQVEATMTGGTITLEGLAPGIRGNGEFLASGNIIIDAKIPAIIGNGLMLSGGIMRLEGNGPAVKGSGTMTSGGVFSIDGVSPAIIGTGHMYRNDITLEGYTPVPVSGASIGLFSTLRKAEKYGVLRHVR